MKTFLINVKFKIFDNESSEGLCLFDFYLEPQMYKLPLRDLLN